MNTENETQAAFIDVPSVMTYLTGRGWHAPRATIYRHVNEKKLRKNAAGVFDIAMLERYAKKYLKRLRIGNDASLNPEETIIHVKDLSAYLMARGWHAPRTTLYNHLKNRKLKRNAAGVFSTIDAERYARKHLRPLAVITEESRDTAALFEKAIVKFCAGHAAKIIEFLNCDVSRADALKQFLIEEAKSYFKTRHQTEGAEHEDQ